MISPVDPGRLVPTHDEVAEEARFPCTSQQLGHWRRQMAQPQSVVGNIAMRWRLLGSVRDQTIEQALQTIVDRHEILRTAFEAPRGEPEQVVTSASIKLAVIDLTRLAQDTAATKAERIAEDEGRKRFDLNAPPLMRSTLIRLAAGEAMLLLTFHPGVIDGWSVGVVARELAALMDAFERKASPDLTEPDLQYGDYALWQRASIDGELSRERAFWHERLREAPNTLMASLGGKGTDQGEAGRISSILLDGAFSQGIGAAAQRAGSTVFAIALASLARLVGRAAAADDIIIGTQVACREDELLFGLVGPVVNTVPLRLSLGGHADRNSLLRHCRSVLGEALEHKALPFEDIAALASGAPLQITVNLGFQPANIDTDDVDAIRCGDIALVSVPSVSTGAFFDLGFFMVQRSEGWRISCEYATVRHDEPAVQGLLEAWCAEMEVLATEAGIRLEGSPDPRPELLPETFTVAPLVASAVLSADAPGEPSRVYFDLLAMQPAGTLPPIFAFNNRSAYYPIARWFGTSRPFVDIQWREDATPPPISSQSITEIAADAAQLIRSFNPNGPYYLMGHCAMGYVAFETARQLRAAGAEVAVIFLLDTVAPGYVENMRRRDRLLRRFLLFDHSWRYFRFLVDEVRGGRMTTGTALSHYSFVRNNSLARLARRFGLIDAASPTGEDLMNHGLMNYLQDAKRHYAAEPYEGDVVFFRSAEARTGRLFNRSFGWDRIVTGSLVIYDVPGPHLHMTREPGASVIAAHAAWLMDRKEGRWHLPSQQA